MEGSAGGPPSPARWLKFHIETLIIHKLSSRKFTTHNDLYPLCGETLEPLARFVRKLPKDLNLAEDGFPVLINQGFLGSFSTDKSIFSA